LLFNVLRSKRNWMRSVAQGRVQQAYPWTHIRWLLTPGSRITHQLQNVGRVGSKKWPASKLCK